MDIRAAEISAILKDQIKNFGQEAEVTSAQALKAEQLTALSGTLKDSFKRDVRLSTQVDPSLLGGLVVKMGSRQIDTTLKTKLNSLKLALKEVG